MPIAPNLPVNTQLLVDSAFVTSGSAAAAITSIDLQQATPFPTTRYVLYQVSSSAIAASTSKWTGSLNIQDSADNSSFTNVAQLAFTVYDTTGTASAAQNQYQLPPNIRRYVRVSPTYVSNSVAFTNVTGSVGQSLLF